jgi:hypothetical protein
MATKGKRNTWEVYNDYNVINSLSYAIVGFILIVNQKQIF